MLTTFTVCDVPAVAAALKVMTTCPVVPVLYVRFVLAELKQIVCAADAPVEHVVARSWTIVAAGAVKASLFRVERAVFVRDGVDRVSRAPS